MSHQERRRSAVAEGGNVCPTLFSAPGNKRRASRASVTNEMEMLESERGSKIYTPYGTASRRRSTNQEMENVEMADMLYEDHTQEDEIKDVLPTSVLREKYRAADPTLQFAGRRLSFGERARNWWICLSPISVALYCMLVPIYFTMSSSLTEYIRLYHNPDPDLFFSLCFLMDIFVVLKFGTRYEKVKHFREMWQVHAISCLPYVYLLPIIFPEIVPTTVVAICFLPRLNFFYTVIIDFIPYWTDFVEDSNTHIWQVCIREFILLLFVLFIVAHLAACLYQLIVDWEIHLQLGYSQVESYILANEGDFMARYFLGFHWAGSAVFVGAMDPAPMTHSERVLSQFAFVSNIVVIGSVVAKISSLILSIADNSEAMENTRVVSKILHKSCIPKRLQERIREFMKERGKRLSLFQCMTMLETILSCPLYNELRYYLHGEQYAGKFFPFQEYGYEFLVSISSSLAHALRCDEDIIFRQGGRAGEMVFLIDGMLGAYRRRSKELAPGQQLKKNEALAQPEVLPMWNAFCWLGEKCMFQREAPLRSATVLSMSFCELLLLTKDDLIETIKTYPEWEQIYEDQCDTLEAAGDDNKMLGSLFGCAICHSDEHYTFSCTMQKKKKSKKNKEPVKAVDEAGKEITLRVSKPWKEIVSSNINSMSNKFLDAKRRSSKIGSGIQIGSGVFGRGKNEMSRAPGSGAPSSASKVVPLSSVAPAGDMTTLSFERPGENKSTSIPQGKTNSAPSKPLGDGVVGLNRHANMKHSSTMQDLTKKRPQESEVRQLQRAGTKPSMNAFPTTLAQDAQGTAMKTIGSSHKTGRGSVTRFTSWQTHEMMKDLMKSNQKVLQNQKYIMNIMVYANSKDGENQEQLQEMIESTRRYLGLTGDDDEDEDEDSDLVSNYCSESEVDEKTISSETATIKKQNAKQKVRFSNVDEEASNLVDKPLTRDKRVKPKRGGTKMIPKEKKLIDSDKEGNEIISVEDTIRHAENMIKDGIS